MSPYRKASILQIAMLLSVAALFATFIYTGSGVVLAVGLPAILLLQALPLGDVVCPRCGHCVTEPVERGFPRLGRWGLFATSLREWVPSRQCRKCGAMLDTTEDSGPKPSGTTTS